MPVTSREYCPGKSLKIDGITYIYVKTLKLNSGQTKECYHCEFCRARVHVFKDTLKCQLMSAHTSRDCVEAYKKWKKEEGKNILEKGDFARLESILEGTSFMEENEDDEPSCIFDLTDATIIQDDSINITLALASLHQTYAESDTSDLSLTSGDVTVVPAMNSHTDTIKLESVTNDLDMARLEETTIAEVADSGVSSADVSQVSALPSKKTLLTPIKRDPASEEGFYALTPRTSNYFMQTVNKPSKIVNSGLKTLDSAILPKAFNSTINKVRPLAGPSASSKAEKKRVTSKFFDDSLSSNKTEKFVNENKSQRYFSDL